MENGKWKIETDRIDTADTHSLVWIAVDSRAVPSMGPISSFEFPFSSSRVAKISPCALCSSSKGTADTESLVWVALDSHGVPRMDRFSSLDFPFSSSYLGPSVG